MAGFHRFLRKAQIWGRKRADQGPCEDCNGLAKRYLLLIKNLWIQTWICRLLYCPINIYIYTYIYIYINMVIFFSYRLAMSFLGERLRFFESRFQLPGVPSCWFHCQQPASTLVEPAWTEECLELADHMFSNVLPFPKCTPKQGSCSRCVSKKPGYFLGVYSWIYINLP